MAAHQLRIWRPYGDYQVTRVDETDLNRFKHASQSSQLLGDSTEMLVFSILSNTNTCEIEARRV